MKKIEYKAPEMEVVEMKLQSALMVISGGGPGKGDEINEDEE